MNLIYSLINGLTFRIRGGLKIPYTDKKFPLNKWWFAIYFACLVCTLKGWTLNLLLIMIIATRISTQIAGWGEYKACCLGVGKPNPKRKDFSELDEFLDNFEFKGWKLIEHSILFGFVGLSIRGLYLSFIIGLALNSIPFMVCGIAWGVICYLCGLFARKVLKKYDKTGWNLDEWCFGFYLGLILCLEI